MARKSKSEQIINADVQNMSYIEAKTEFARYVQQLKMELIEAEFKKQIGTLSFKKLIANDEVSKKELETLWNNAQKMFNM